MNFYNTAQPDVLDILFANRNKSYGAYQLRKNYNKRLITAIIVTVCICLVATILFRTVLSTKSNHTLINIVGSEITLKRSDIKDHSIIEPVHIKPLKPLHSNSHVATIKITPPVIVADNLITTPPASNQNIDPIKIDIATISGTSDDNTMPADGKGTGKIETPVAAIDYNTVFHTVQQQARFPGGTEAWKTYLERNLRQDVPTDNGAPVGNYTVLISFLVDKEGIISEVKVENDPGYGTAAEAVRVIERGPKWYPAMQNGHAVLYRQTQAITFAVTEVN